MYVKQLQQKAEEIRIDTIKSLYNAQSGHPGSSLGIVDILTVLYFGGVLEKRPEDPHWEGRDYFLLSNGHAAPGLYSTLAHAGYYPEEKLAGGLRKFGSPMRGHPKRGTFPGVEISSGSIGMGLSEGIGIALGLRMRERDNRVYVMESDGGMQEGSSWEAVMYAAGLGLDNLTLIVDDNGSQINGPSRKIMPGLFPIGERLSTFGWGIAEVDGHDYGELMDAFGKAKEAKTVFAIVAKTKIGRGVSFMEGDWRWHHGKLSEEQYRQAMNDLGVEE